MKSWSSSLSLKRYMSRPLSPLGQYSPTTVRFGAKALGTFRLGVKYGVVIDQRALQTVPLSSVAHLRWTLHDESILDTDRYHVMKMPYLKSHPSLVNTLASALTTYGILNVIRPHSSLKIYCTIARANLYHKPPYSFRRRAHSSTTWATPAAIGTIPSVGRPMP
ncbi:hypothetical protein P170DRAFT_95310 [Aspergillus steynii IBT 23096]|uniref:Uncharacterized protein n=1 Tax=Aspergillus steynii IBT 23096 TaxID=1392250 RepID=A0A2I2GGJ3_9EURO|nr:uncharacterized protein P170DRAFT_95310 [Aspergillus steynii IBT 23096]PLB52008.1 hypothetical protein P170DRAFT_95310 [Aspergillus steynii IBT 23096]